MEQLQEQRRQQDILFKQQCLLVQQQRQQLQRQQQQFQQQQCLQPPYLPPWQQVQQPPVPQPRVKVDIPTQQQPQQQQQQQQPPQPQSQQPATQNITQFSRFPLKAHQIHLSQISREKAMQHLQDIKALSQPPQKKAQKNSPQQKSQPTHIPCPRHKPQQTTQQKRQQKQQLLLQQQQQRSVNPQDDKHQYEMFQDQLRETMQKPALLARYGVNEGSPEAILQCVAKLDSVQLLCFSPVLLRGFLMGCARFGLAVLIRGNYPGGLEGLSKDKSVSVAGNVIAFIDRTTSMYEHGELTQLDVERLVSRDVHALVQLAHLMDVVVLRSVFRSGVTPYSKDPPCTTAEVEAMKRICLSLKVMTKRFVMESGGQTLFALFPQMFTGMTDILSILVPRWDLEREPTGFDMVAQLFQWFVFMNNNFSVKRIVIPHPRTKTGRFFDVVLSTIKYFVPLALSDPPAQVLAAQVLDLVFLALISLINDDNFDNAAPAYLDSVIGVCSTAREKLGAIISATVNFVAAAVNARNWTLDALQSGLKLLELFADDSNFKADTARLVTPLLFAPLFMLPETEINSIFNDRVCGGRRTLEMLFRVAGNLHCYNPEVCKPTDKNAFARALTEELKKKKDIPNCVKAFAGMFAHAVTSEDKEESRSIQQREYDINKIRETLLKTTLIQMDADLFSELSQVVTKHIKKKTKKKKEKIF